MAKIVLSPIPAWQMADLFDPSITRNPMSNLNPTAPPQSKMGPKNAKIQTKIDFKTKFLEFHVELTSSRNHLKASPTLRYPCEQAACSWPWRDLPFHLGWMVQPKTRRWRWWATSNQQSIRINLHVDTCCFSTCIYIYTHIHMDIHVPVQSVHIQIQIHIHLHMHICIHIYIYTHEHTCNHIYIYIMYYVLYVCMCTLYTYIYIIIHIIIYKCIYIYIYWSTASIRRDMTTPLSFMFGNRIIDNNHMHRMVLLQLYKHYLVKIRYRVVSTVAWSTRLVLTLRFGSGPWLNRACCACRIKKPLRSLKLTKG